MRSPRFPRTRWDVDADYDPEPGAPGEDVHREGGFVERVDDFDPQFFGISPRVRRSAWIPSSECCSR